MNPRIYQRLIQPHLAVPHLEQIFDIPSIKVLPSLAKSIHVIVVPSDELGLLTLEVTYKERSTLEHDGWQLMDTCKDIQGVIYSYLQDTLKVTIQMDFRERWPIWAPKLKVTHCSDDRYKITPVVNQFHCDLRAEWSPALGFDKALLMLLSRILEAIKYV
jgi:hypothetical protein